MIATGCKEVYCLISFLGYTDAGYPIKHGALYFSSLEKLRELCLWDTSSDIICIEYVSEKFNNLDFVPDNY